jgi:Fe-S cluster biogenesis protein NfuA
MSLDPPLARETLKDRVRAVLAREMAEGTLAGEDDVDLVDIDADRIVQIRLGGGCSSCPATLVPLVFGLERAIKSAVPEIRFVEAVP